MGTLAALVLAIAMSGPAFADEATSVYAAGSLREALGEIAQAWQQHGGHPVKLTFGASGLLRQQIEEGATAQVFASADMEHPAQLAKSGAWQEPVTFARNALCALASPSAQVTQDTLLTTILRSDVKLGTSTPKSDPSGDYAWQLFRMADRLQPGAYAVLDRKAIKLAGAADSPKPPGGRLVYAWAVDTRQADVFLTYCTNALAATREVASLQVIQLPPNLRVDAAYGMAVRRDAGNDAREFVDFVLAPAGQEILKRHGFLEARP